MIFVISHLFGSFPAFYLGRKAQELCGADPTRGQRAPCSAWRKDCCCCWSLLGLVGSSAGRSYDVLTPFNGILNRGEKNAMP